MRRIAFLFGSTSGGRGRPIGRGRTAVCFGDGADGDGVVVVRAKLVDAVLDGDALSFFDLFVINLAGHCVNRAEPNVQTSHQRS